MRPDEDDPEQCNAELEGEAQTTLAAGVASKPALAAEDAGDALRDGFAAPATRGHDERAAEKIVPGREFVMMVEATTTVAVMSETHGCTSTSYVANAKISELPVADEAIGPSELKVLQPYSNSPKLVVCRPKVKGNQSSGEASQVWALVKMSLSLRHAKTHSFLYSGSRLSRNLTSESLGKVNC